MKIIMSLCLLLSTLSAYAVKSPEVLYLDPEDDLSQRSFLISNSIHKGSLGIRNNRGTLSAVLKCGEDEKKIKLKNKKTTEIEIDSLHDECTLQLGNKGVVRLIKDEVAFPLLKELNHHKDSCQYTKPSVEPISQMFLTSNYPIMGCAHPSDQVEILTESEDGLLSKMEALLGYKPSKDFIYKQDPYGELDFSKAPKLDAIMVSTLLYRHDFSGAVLARLLKHHALKGTLVNIIGTGYMHSKQDKALLRELSKIPNIRIQEYKYHDPRRGLAPLFSALTNYLRDMHVKMFITLSLSSPENNVMIMGGRNVHDGFVFAERPDLSQFPELNQNDPKAPYAFWNDLEIKVTSQTLAKSVYAHLLTLWNRKVKGQVTEQISLPEREAQKISGEEILNSTAPMIRHLLTLPFNDDHALEKLFVEMIDKAQTTIKLSSPYLRPTKGIMEAIERAIKRKVDITIQTRINLKGDTQAWLYEETNKAAINALFNKIKIYEWTEDSILHTKLLLIDERFAFFGSVNLSRRSFIQDVENGFLIHGEALTQKFHTIFDDYNKRSTLLNQKQKRKFWATIFMTMIQNQF